MTPLPNRRTWLLAVSLLWLVACARPWMLDESGRIDENMRCEAFSFSTAGAEGITLGNDAPPLAPPFVEPTRYIYGGRRGFGDGFGLIGRGRGR